VKQAMLPAGAEFIDNPALVDQARHLYRQLLNFAVDNSANRNINT